MLPQLYAQSLKSKPASEHGAAAKPDAASQTPVSQIPAYLGWGLVPAAGILVGGAFWLGKKSERNATNSLDSIESEDELNYLPVLEAATENNHHVTAQRKYRN